MDDFYKKLDDNDRVFFLSYYRIQLLRNNPYCDDPPDLTIENIRKEIHPYYSQDEFKDVSDKDIRKHFVDSQWMSAVEIADGTIQFHSGIYDLLQPTIKEIIGIFTSPEFFQFICKYQNLSLKRQIINEISKYQVSAERSTIKQANLLLFIINNFEEITNLYLELKGEFIF